MEARNDIPLHPIPTDAPPYEPNDESSVDQREEHAHNDHEVTLPYEAPVEEVLPPYERRDPVHLLSTPLHRNVYILFPTALYVCLAAYCWLTLAILSRTSLITTDKNHKELQYKAARYLQPIVNIATVPVISAVCAWAAAIFVQNQPDAYSLSLRQVMFLADRAWMNPLEYARMIFYPSRFKTYGSSFLFLAIFIHIFGVITFPIQNLFLSTRVVNTAGTYRWGEFDYDSTYGSYQTIGELKTGEYATGTAILAVRDALQRSGINGAQSQLWGNTSSLSEYNPQSTWFAQPDFNTSTGPFTGQLVPRVNSSAEILNVTTGEFPSNCAETPNWFYAYYDYTNTSYYNVTLEICAPMNLSASPWQGNDGRQDFSEVFYVNATANLSSYYWSHAYAPSFGGGLFKVVMNTTAGSFELPNLYNDNTPGPLINNASLCLDSTYCDGTSKSRRYYEYFEPPLAGPLTIIALALFGPGSWADMQQTALDSGDILQNETGWQQYLDYSAEEGPLPLENLGVVPHSSSVQIDNWVFSLTSNRSAAAISSAFTQAGFLASQAIFNSGTPTYYEGARIELLSHPLEQIVLPSLSLAGLVVGSVLFGLYIIPLICLAIYAAYYHRWTHTLDAFTMLRMGAALGQKDLPLLVGYLKRDIQALDNLPGVVRDISGPDDKIRQLALGVGGGMPLQPKKRYLAYPGNHDK